MNSYGSYGSFQPASRARSASPKSRESEVYDGYFGGSGGQSSPNLFGQSPKHGPGSLSGAQSRTSLWSSGALRRGPQSGKKSQSIKRSSSYAGQRSSPQSPQNSAQHSRPSTNYNRPWLQKNVRPDGTLVDKSETRRTKETATWWNREADRMAHAISKLKTHRDELVAELAQAEKTVRQHNYELGLARAAHDRQKEQAEAAADRRTELEQEVIRLRQETKESKSEAITKKDEVERLREKAQDLEDQVAEAKRQRAEKEEQMARRAAAEERQRLSAAASPTDSRQASDMADGTSDSAGDQWSHPTIHASAGAVARRNSARASIAAPKRTSISRNSAFKSLPTASSPTLR